MGMHSGRLSKFRKLQQESNNAGCAQQILAQLGFLLELSAIRECRFDDTILPHIEYLSSVTKREGAITNHSVAQVESHLALLESEAKEYSVYCVVQPPMDPPTEQDPLFYIRQVRYALELLEKHTEITYFEPRAAVYRLLELYQPELLKKVIYWVQDGRWEVGVTGWNSLEPQVQKTESTYHHLIENKKYLSKLLGIPVTDITIHFEADGFGVNPKYMELLSTANLNFDYRYGCAKQDYFSVKTGTGREVFHLKGRNQQHIRAGEELSLFISEFFRQRHEQICLRVIELDVNEPEQADRCIEQMKRMSQWPLFPKILFSSVQSFCRVARKAHKDTLDPMTWERQFSDVGFYHQKRNQWNLLEEQKQLDALSLDAQAHMLSADYVTPYSREQMETLRLNVPVQQELMNTASSVTREHAVNSLCIEMDTWDVNHGSDKNTGFEQTDFAIQQSNTHHYPAENLSHDFPYIFTVFNTTQFPHKRVVEVVVPKWNGSINLLHVVDSKGREVSSQVEQELNEKQVRISFLADIPQFGYATYRVNCEQEWFLEAAPFTPRQAFSGGGERVVLENQYIRACFSMRTMTLQSFVHKQHRVDLANTSQQGGVFQLCLRDEQENPSLKIAPSYIINLNEEYPVEVKNVYFGGVRCWIDYEIAFEQSLLEVRIVLDQHAQALRWEARVKWSPDTLALKGCWTLRFMMPFDGASTDTLYQTQWGAWENPTNTQMLLGAHAIAPVVLSGNTYNIALLAQGNHSLARIDNTLVANLITPEIDPHSCDKDNRYFFKMGVAVGGTQKKHLAEQSSVFVNPVYCVKNSVHHGRIPATGELMKLSGNVSLSYAWANPDGSGIFVRIYNQSFHEESAMLSFVREVSSITIVDCNLDVYEILHLATRNSTDLKVPANGTMTLKIVFI